MLLPYSHPTDFPRSKEYQLEINGIPVDVLRCDLASFAVCAIINDKVCVKLKSLNGAFTTASVHPLRLGVPVRIINETTLEFTLTRATSVVVHLQGLPDLYLFLHAERDIEPNKPDVLRIPSGTIMEVPTLDLDGYSGLHIEAGAVLRTRMLVKNKPELRISGHGIFDGSLYTRAKDGYIPSIVLDRCPGTVIQDITMVNPAGWMILLGASDNSIVRNVHQLGKVVSSDGIDILGSSNVLVEDCFLSNNDDCVVVKAFEVSKNNLDATHVDGRRNVSNILIRRCVLANGPAGNAMEVGHELTVDSVRNIRFEDIDVLSVHGSGAVFAIHNGDHATVEDVVFEDIRIEHCYDKLIDIRVMKSMFNTDKERGHIRNVALRNVNWISQRCNFGYTISIIGGWDAEHTIENVTLKNFCIDGKPIQSIDDLEIFTRHASGINVVD